jgi:signal transduction histidine kinase/DNA-binding response OmpR family regulator/ligand-binding sensor domain-containing protein
MAEVNNGDLLFGVDQGIMRYSGYDWNMIPFPDSISDLSITALCAGLDGSIWTGTDEGLFVLRNGIWHKVFPETGIEKTVITDIIRLPGGSLLAGISAGGSSSAISGLMHIDNNSKTLYCSSYTYQQLIKLPDRGYSLYLIPESLTIPNLNGFGVFNISDLHIQRDGRIAIAISNKHTKGKISICSFNRGAPGNILVEEVFTENDGLSIKSSVKVTESQAGELWVVSTTSDMGIQLYKNETWQEIRTSDIFGGQESHNSVMACSDGSVWIEGNGSIFVAINGQWKVYKHPKIPITTASKYIFHEASDGKIWVLGVLDELFLFDNTFEKWITYEGLIFQGETSSGESWFLNRDGKVILNRHGEWMAYGEKDGLMDTPVRIFITSNDEIWALGSHRQSAASAYLQNDEWKMLLHPELSWGMDHRGCYESDDGLLWFGCGIDIQKNRGHKGGVIRFQTTDEGSLEWNQLPEDENIIIGNAYGIGSSKNGRIWIGGRPLWTFYEGTWTKFTGDKKLEEYVDDIDTDAQGNLWLASRYYGIFRYDGESWENYTTENGLPSNNIISIFAESESEVWATTHGGVSRFDGKIWSDVDFLGVMSLVNEGGTIMKGKKGHIWFNNSTNDWYKRALTREKTDPIAYERFKTIRYTPDQTPPETSFITYQRRFRQQEDSYFFWEGRDFFNETSADKLQFSWRLNDNPWTPFSNKTLHTFNRLKPGHYRMEVRSRDMCLNLDTSPAAIEFRVMTPWWKHPAFIIITVFTLGLIAFLQFRILSNNKKLRFLNESLENKSDELNSTLEKMQNLIYSRLRFFTNISHEFRTPLGLIIGPIEELRESKSRISTSTRKKYYDIIHRNASRILRLINQILEVYKVEESTLEFKPTVGDLAGQISEIVDLFEHLTNQHGISLKFEPENKVMVFSYDHDKIEKIIFNLLSNAIRNVPPNGSIKITVELKTEGNNRMACISVSDNGKGILPEDSKKIFERFYHNDSGSYRQLHVGMGIGLAYIKDLVKAHKGSIDVSSEPGVETVFVVKIPYSEITGQLQKKSDLKGKSTDSLSVDIQKAVAELDSYLSDRQQEEEDDEGMFIKEDNEKRASILIVDDDMDTRVFIRHCLEHRFNILEAKDGLEGIHTARLGHPDLIISDVMMPEHDGLQFCQTIKTDFDTSHIPFILLSARAMVSDKIKGIEIGADAYVEKPFNKKLLLSHVDNLLKSRSLLRKRFREEIQIRPSEMKMASLDEQFIEKTVASIEKNIDDENLDADKLSIEVGVSRIQLYRKTKALTGQTVNQFVRSIRLKKAARLLKEQRMSVSEIAYIVGFSAPIHFASYFKEYFGTTPTEYRDQR